MITEQHPHLGTGWAFPPRWAPTDPTDPASAVTLATSAGTDHVREAMHVLLRTAIGARLMRPGLGVGVDRYVFEPRTPEVCYRLAHDVERALLLWEPRVVVESVEAVPSGSAEDRIDITITYRVDRHSRPDNLVIPFSLQEEP